MGLFHPGVNIWTAVGNRQIFVLLFGKAGALIAVRSLQEHTNISALCDQIVQFHVQSFQVVNFVDGPEKNRVLRVSVEGWEQRTQPKTTSHTNKRFFLVESLDTVTIRTFNQQPNFEISLFIGWDLGKALGNTLLDSHIHGDFILALDWRADNTERMRLETLVPDGGVEEVEIKVVARLVNAVIDITLWDGDGQGVFADKVEFNSSESSVESKDLPTTNDSVVHSNGDD